MLAHGYSRGNDAPGIAAFRAAWRDPAARLPLSQHVSLLHCTTEYPCPPADVNLTAMAAMRTRVPASGRLFRSHRRLRDFAGGRRARRRHHRETSHARSQRRRAGPRGLAGARGFQAHGVGHPQHRGCLRRRREGAEGIPRSGTFRWRARASLRRARSRPATSSVPDDITTQAARLGSLADRILVADRHHGDAGLRQRRSVMNSGTATCLAGTPRSDGSFAARMP